jgi:outer membrane lipoprotein-sorting protein
VIEPFPNERRSQMKTKGLPVAFVSRMLMGLTICGLIALWPPAVLAGAEEPRPKEKLPSGKEVLQRSIEAIGGKEKLAKIQNRVAEATMEIKDLGIKGTLTVYQARPNKMYTKVEIEGVGSVEQGTDGKVVWELNPMTGPRVKQGEERAAMLLFSHFDESELLDLYEKVECVGEEKVEGEACYKVVCTPKDAPPFTTYYSQASGLPVKAVVTFPHQFGKIEIENLTSDYKEVDGILLPHHTVEKAMSVESHATLTSYKHNVKLPDDRFDPPAEIKALLEQAAKEPVEESGPREGAAAEPPEK